LALACAIAKENYMRSFLTTTLGIAASLAIVACCASPAAAQWGTLKGRFVYKGKPFKSVPAVITKDAQFCGKFNIQQPSPQIGKNGGVGGLLVWIYLDKADPTPKSHPRYRVPQPPPVLDNLQCSFAPNAVFVRTLKPFQVKNSDTVPHSTAMNFINNREKSANPQLQPKQVLNFVLTKRERIPIPITCGFHPWMKCYLVVTDHPYAVVTQEDGTFELKDLPAGKHTFQVRHMVGKGGYVDDVKVKGAATKWTKGKIEVGIPSGAVIDLGDIEVDASVF